MAKDPYKYFRIEARELLDGLSHGILALEKSESSREVVGELLRLAHTLKGASRVVKQKEVAELAHGIEDVLGPYRDASGAMSNDKVSQLLALVDACHERLKPVFAPPGQEQQTAPTPEVAGNYSSVRVEISEMDGLLYDLANAGSHLGALCKETATLERTAETASTLVEELAALSARPDDANWGPTASHLRSLAEELRASLKRTHRSFRAGLERAHRNVNAIRDQAGDLRLLPAKSIFDALERTARDAADALKKNVRFAATGGEHRLDAHVLLALREALAHVVRNAVAHGIEVDSKRTAAGKPPAGQVALHVSKKGQRLQFVVSDDGAGINLEAIRETLIARDLIEPHLAMSLELPEATQLLFEGGFSTASEVTEVMGRGIGLDVVKATATRLKGDVHLRTDPGHGTSVEIVVPVSLESMDVLGIDAGDRSALFPFDAIRRTVRVASSDLARTTTGTMLIVDGQALPFLHLSDLLGAKRQPLPVTGKWTTLIIHARGLQAAIGVDRLNGVRNVVIRPLPALAGAVPLVTGATLDGEGNPELVLDAGAIVTAVHSQTQVRLDMLHRG